MVLFSYFLLIKYNFVKIFTYLNPWLLVDSKIGEVKLEKGISRIINTGQPKSMPLLEDRAVLQQIFLLVLYYYLDQTPPDRESD